MLKYIASIISSLHTPSNQNVSPSFMLHINWGSIRAGKLQCHSLDNIKHHPEMTVPAGKALCSASPFCHYN